MIRFFDQILLDDTPLFTRLELRSPLTDSLELPSDACYLYIEKGTGNTLFNIGHITNDTGTTILSTCGLTMGNMISEQTEGEMQTIIVHLNSGVLKRVFDHDKPALWQELERPINKFVVQQSANLLVQAFFKSIESFFENKEVLSPSVLELKLKEIVLLLLQSDNSEDVRQIMKSLFSERTFTFKETVDAHLFSAVTIEALSQLTNTSLSTFKRRFKEIYDQSPAKYIQEKRLDKVSEKLRTSDDQISHIGYDLGFESPEHLSRAFKNKFGITPSEYRMSFSVK